LTYRTLELTISGVVWTVVLNRPLTRNALDEIAIEELTQVMGLAASDSVVRAVVLKANGPVFCAGADLAWMQRTAKLNEDDNLIDASRLAAMLKRLHDCPVPVIAQIHGDCYGGGLGLVAACDIAVAAETARFCLSEVRLGLVPATIAPYVLKAMDHRAARRYFMTAERFDAAEAQRIGIVHVTAAADRLDATVGGLLDALLAGGPTAIRQAKKLIREIESVPIDDALVANTSKRLADIRVSPEGREGIAAFLEKRKPLW
jgi:methylglutaconyl-CoA hydratase